MLQEILEDNSMIKKYKNNYILNYWTLKKNRKEEKIIPNVSIEKEE